MALPEVWLRGPLPHINPFLQPVAHALLQAGEEAADLMASFPDHLLWIKPSGLASAGFHLQHMTGVLDRLFTYARGEALSPAQLQYLQEEGTCPKADCSTGYLLEQMQVQIAKSIDVLRLVEAETLTQFRGVGRAQLPSTVLGLYVHAAEHTMRHLGQLLVTTRLIRANEEDKRG